MNALNHALRCQSLGYRALARTWGRFAAKDYPTRFLATCLMAAVVPLNDALWILTGRLA
jgi:hypothetical protein